MMLAYKSEKKLKELLMEADPYNTLKTLMMKFTRVFLASKGVTHVQTLWSQKVVSNVSLQKEFTKLDGPPHAFPKM